MIGVNFDFDSRGRYHATIEGERFLIGKRVRYGGRRGLMNSEPLAHLAYHAGEWRDAHGAWADFIEPIARVEGGHFHHLNTYDRARFTFGFMQAGAHVPEGAFVHWLRALLALPRAADYLPEWLLADGRIAARAEDGKAARPLEDGSGTGGLLDALNPSTAEVEDVEVIQSARLIHWVRNDRGAVALQVAVAVAQMQSNMADHVERYRLDARDDITCLLVADIRHQGRAPHAAIRRALAAADPHAALLALGERQWPERTRVLREQVQRLRTEGRLGLRRFDAGQGRFV